MKELATVHNLTMSSLEIAELCEKEHRNVTRDIRKMLSELGLGVLSFEHTYLDSQGKTQVCYNLPKDLTYTLVAGYSVTLRKRIIDRWLELESGPTNIEHHLAVIADNSTRLTDAVIQHGGRLEVVETGLEDVRSRVINIEDRLPYKRKPPRKSDKAQLIDAARRMGGACPLDGITQMFDESDRFIGQIDHYHNPARNKLSELWPLSVDNHRLKSAGEIAEAELRAAFDSFHARMGRLAPKQTELW